MADLTENTVDSSPTEANQDSGDKKPDSEDAGELDDLLDSALEDFGKPVPTPATSEPKTDTESQPKLEEGASDESKDTLPPSQEALFNELFHSEANMGAAADFQNAMGDLMAELGKEFSQDPQFNEELSKLLQTTVPPGAMPQSSASPSSSTAPSGSTSTSAGPAAPGSEDDIARTLGETLNRMSQNAQELQQDTGVPEDFMRAFEGMNMGDGDAELLPMMQSIMQNLLSKEVLYPSLKEVVGKYPQWLTEHKDSIPETDHDRYSKQLDIMQRLCTEYEAESDSDSLDVKQQRTMRVMDLIQQMESLGQPPKDIVGDMGPGFQFDAQGNPSIPGMIPGMMPGMMPGMPPGMPQGDQCSIM